MTTLFNSLTTISDGYTIFEKDQVLTEAQLNSVSQYLDDNNRLTRISLVGVGIVCGLRTICSGATVTLTKGIGITTDGDLLRVSTATQYNQFKPYDNQFPKYPPLYANSNNMLNAYELIAVSDNDPLAIDLNQFASSTGAQLSNMVALLLMESYIKNSNLCTGADCDNRGQEYISRQRLLLIEKSSAGSLLPSIQTADAAARNLGQITPQRATVNNSLATHSQLASRYRSACNTMHARISHELPKIWGNLSFLLQRKLSGNPAPAWEARLNSIHSRFSSHNTNIQYYYDFLNDIAETWNEMRELLFGESAWYCPDVNSFPKHLMLGNLIPTDNSISAINENRFKFYPAKAIDHGLHLEEALFLVQKIDALIKNFSPTISSEASSSIRVTPSYTAQQSLQERAIPCYYQINSTTPMHKLWSFKLHQREMDRYNYSYHANSYNAQGAAANPLNSSISHNDFFRIEGHLGQHVTSALNSIENKVRNLNLPFSVCSVLLGTNRENIPDKKGAGYTDLHRFHYLFRQDIVHKLDEVTQYSQTLKNDIDQAITDNIIKDDVAGNDGINIKTITANKHSTVTTKATAAKGKLNVNYMNYTGDISWMSDIGDTMLAAGQFQANLNKVVATSYVTSFDHLIGNTTLNLLPWIDRLIDEKDNKADAKKLFKNFINEHPGLEHTGGVIRGGTFILVHNDAGTVIADFMLSHYIKETVEEPAQEPPLTKPAIPRGNILEGNIHIAKSWDNYISDKFTSFKEVINQEWIGKFDVQTAYADALKDSIQIWQGVWQGGEIGSKTTPATGTSFDDSILEALKDRATNETRLIKALENKLSNDSLLQDEKELYKNELLQSQESLAKNVESIAQHLETKGTDLSQGTEGYFAMKEVSDGITAIKNNPLISDTLTTTLRNMQENTKHVGLESALDTILNY